MLSEDKPGRPVRFPVRKHLWVCLITSYLASAPWLLPEWATLSFRHLQACVCLSRESSGNRPGAPSCEAGWEPKALWRG